MDKRVYKGIKQEKRGVCVNTKKITEGAILLAIYTVLFLVFLYVPLLGKLLTLALPIPFIYYTAKYNWKDGLLFFAGAVGISIIIGSLLTIPTTFIFGLTGFTIGYFIHNKKSRFSTFMTATLVMLVNIVLQYVLISVFFDINFLQEFIAAIDESFKQSIAIYELLGQEVPANLEQQLASFVMILQLVLPTILVMVSACLVLIIQLVSFPIIKRLGIEIPNALPFRDLTLPKVIVWLYLIVLLISFIVPINQGTFLYSAIINLMFIMQFLFIFQGITFVFNFAHKKKVTKAVPVIVTIFAILNPLLNQVLQILGIIDVGFDLRKKIEMKKQ